MFAFHRNISSSLMFPQAFYVSFTPTVRTLCMEMCEYINRYVDVRPFHSQPALWTQAYTIACGPDIRSNATYVFKHPIKRRCAQVMLLGVDCMPIISCILSFFSFITNEITSTGTHVKSLIEMNG